MELDFAFLADAAVVDGTGKLSVLGVFDRIRARDFPARHGRIALVMRLAAQPEDEGEHRVEIVLRGPEDQDVLRLDGQVRLGPTKPARGATRIAQVLNLDGVVFPQAGRYRFEIRINDQAATPVHLVLEGAESRETGPAGPFGTTGPEGVPIVFAPGGPAEA